jgi:hypothetical protein
MIGDIVWDNGMDYDDLLRAEFDENASIDAFPADDFSFINDTIIKDVTWIGGYWSTGYNESHWTWEIVFYNDDGTGDKPGSSFAGEFIFDEGNYTEIIVEENPSIIFYEINVKFPESIIFEGGKKYWISIWAVGNEPPFSGWGFHYDSVLLHEAVFKSFYFLGDYLWHDTSIVLGSPADMCFQLGGMKLSDDTTPPTIEIVRPGRGLYLFERFIIPRFIRITQVIGRITIEINATDNESGVSSVVILYGPLGKRVLANISEPPYVYTWRRDRLRFIHFHTLKIVAFDNAGNHGHAKMYVRKII